MEGFALDPEVEARIQQKRDEGIMNGTLAVGKDGLAYITEAGLNANYQHRVERVHKGTLSVTHLYKS